jgi:hypothetical protein
MVLGAREWRRLASGFSRFKLLEQRSRTLFLLQKVGQSRTRRSKWVQSLNQELLDRLRHQTGVGGRELRCARLAFGSLSKNDLVQRRDIGERGRSKSG